MDVPLHPPTVRCPDSPLVQAAEQTHVQHMRTVVRDSCFDMLRCMVKVENVTTG